MVRRIYALVPFLLVLLVIPISVSAVVVENVTDVAWTGSPGDDPEVIWDADNSTYSIWSNDHLISMNYSIRGWENCSDSTWYVISDTSVGSGTLYSTSLDTIYAGSCCDGIEDDKLILRLQINSEMDGLYSMGQCWDGTQWANLTDYSIPNGYIEHIYNEWMDFSLLSLGEGQCIYVEDGDSVAFEGSWTNQGYCYDGDWDTICSPTSSFSKQNYYVNYTIPSNADNSSMVMAKYYYDAPSTNTTNHTIPDSCMDSVSLELAFDVEGNDYDGDTQIDVYCKNSTGWGLIDVLYTPGNGDGLFEEGMYWCSTPTTTSTTTTTTTTTTTIPDSPQATGLSGAMVTLIGLGTGLGTFVGLLATILILPQVSDDPKKLRMALAWLFILLAFSVAMSTLISQL